MCRRGQDGEQVAVICLDLNSLKRVNETFGYTMGDAVLQAFAKRLTHTLEGVGLEPDRLSISRFGGDEFIVVLRQREARDAALKWRKPAHRHSCSPSPTNSLEFFSAPSVGFAIYPDDGADVATIFKFADTAMYQAESLAAQSRPTCLR